MKILNQLAKAMGFIGLFLLALFESYLIALLIACTSASLIFAVWSFITPLPAYVGAHYGVLILQGAIPISIGLCVYIMKISTK